MSFGGGGNDEVMSEINVTPLCDIFVVLLIIFMITGEAVTAKGPEVDVPESSFEMKNDAILCVSMKKDKTYWVGLEQVQRGELQKKVAEELLKPNLANKNVIFKGDKGLLMRDVVAVMMECSNAGAEQVAIMSPYNPEAK